MKVLVVYYSMYGHMLQMARAVAKGAGEIDGVEVVLRRCEELPHVAQRIEGDEFMRKVRDSQADIPICTALFPAGGWIRDRIADPLWEHGGAGEVFNRWTRRPVG